MCIYIYIYLSLYIYIYIYIYIRGHVAGSNAWHHGHHRLTAN